MRLSPIVSHGTARGGKGEIRRSNRFYPGPRAACADPGTQLIMRSGFLTLRDAACQLFDLLLLRAAGLGLLGLRRGLLPGGALQLFAFLFVFNLGGICHLVPLSLKSLLGSRKSGRYNPYANRDLIRAKASSPQRTPRLSHFQRTMRLDLNFQRPDSALRKTARLRPFHRS